jgi:hypothetical protein
MRHARNLKHHQFRCEVEDKNDSDWVKSMGKDSIMNDDGKFYE